MELSAFAGNRRLKEQLAGQEERHGLSHAYILSGPPRLRAAYAGPAAGRRYGMYRAAGGTPLRPVRRLPKGK